VFFTCKSGSPQFSIPLLMIPNGSKKPLVSASWLDAFQFEIRAIFCFLNGHRERWKCVFCTRKKPLALSRATAIPVSRTWTSIQRSGLQRRSFHEELTFAGKSRSYIQPKSREVLNFNLLWPRENRKENAYKTPFTPLNFKGSFYWEKNRVTIHHQYVILLPRQISL
jgi:hypothetical protein